MLAFHDQIEAGNWCHENAAGRSCSVRIPNHGFTYIRALENESRFLWDRDHFVLPIHPDRQRDRLVTDIPEAEDAN